MKSTVTNGADPKYAYAYEPHGPWSQPYRSREHAEEVAHRAVTHFMAVWTAEVKVLSLGDLVRGHVGDWLAYDLAEGHDFLHWCEVPEKEKLALETLVGDVIDSWARQTNNQTKLYRYVNIEQGPTNLDIKNMRVATKGGDFKYESDGPVENEGHYMSLMGRIDRFRCRQKRVDLNGVPLDVRIEEMTRAMLAWDTQFPTASLRNYERRVCEIKAVLRSPWPALGIYERDGVGNRIYDTQWTDEEQANRKRYPELQRELQWLKRRLTQIYAARAGHRSQRKKDPNLFRSVMEPWTEVKSR